VLRTEFRKCNENNALAASTKNPSIRRIKNSNDFNALTAPPRNRAVTALERRIRFDASFDASPAESVSLPRIFGAQTVSNGGGAS